MHEAIGTWTDRRHKTIRSQSAPQSARMHQTITDQCCYTRYQQHHAYMCTCSLFMFCYAAFDFVDGTITVSARFPSPNSNY